jgi:hypothetical protein
MTLLTRLSLSLTALALASSLLSPLPNAQAAPASRLTGGPSTSRIVPPTSRVTRRRLSFRVGVKPSNYRVGGFARSEGCPVRDQIKTLTAQATSSSTTASKTADPTTLDRPVLFVYVPTMAASNVQFTIRPNGGRAKDLQNVTFQTTGAEGFVGIELPNNAKLEVGQQYKWSMAIPCRPDENDVTKTVIIEGLVQRIQAPTIATAIPEERAAIYAEQGIWQDALSTIAQLRLQRPQDVALAEDWSNLMTSAGMTHFAKAPVIGIFK